MTGYALMSSTGNIIDSFDKEPEARAALERTVALEPESAEEIALFISDDAGPSSRDRSTPSPTPLADRHQDCVPRGRDVVRRAIQASISAGR